MFVYMRVHMHIHKGMCTYKHKNIHKNQTHTKKMSAKSLSKIDILFTKHSDQYV